jgi:hypothetical protein
MNATPCPPDFLDRVSYPKANDLHGWLAALLRLNALLWDGAGELRDEWRDLISEIDRFVPAYIGPPPVESINRKEAAREPRALEKPSLLVRVHLGAPDATIIEQFRRVLAEARKQAPAPVRNRGRDKQNGKFTPSFISSWQNHRIIGLGELLAWREKRSPDERPSDAQLGRWLGLNGGRDVFLAKQTLERALRLIPALAAQLNANSALPSANPCK